MAANRWRQHAASGLAIARLLPAYLAFALLKHAIPLRVLARAAWREPSGPRNIEAESRVVARIVRTRTLFPFWDGDCLQKSLLLYRELSRAGASPILAVGFRREVRRLEGHAWVVVDGRAVADGASNTAGFTLLCQFGRRGQLILAPPDSPAV